MSEPGVGPLERISRLVLRLAAREHRHRRSRREAWLAGAADAREIEWRLREYERAAGRSGHR